MKNKNITSKYSLKNNKNKYKYKYKYKYFIIN